MRKYLYVTGAYGLSVIALHFFSGRFSPLSSWGFYHLQEFPPALVLFTSFLAAAVCLPPVNAALFDLLIKLKSRTSLLKVRPSPHLVYIIVSLLSVAIFWLFRSGNLFLGDGVTVAKVARTDAAFRYYIGGWAGHITSHQALDYWIARHLHKILSGFTNFESYDSVALRSCIAGGIFVVAVFEIGHLLFDSWGKRLAFSAAVFATGAMQLFFGYVETYSLATGFLALFCLSTLLYVRGRLPIAVAALLLAISGSLHMLALGAGAALLAAYVFRSRERDYFCKWEFAAILAVPVLVVAIYVLIFQSMGFSVKEIFFSGAREQYEGVFFLGLHRKGYLLERYTLLSLPHLIDVFNEILLVSPFGLFLCALALPSARKSRLLSRPEPWILFLTAAVYLAVTLTAAPLLGARKDWDVFAPPWIFMTMLGVYLLIHAVPDSRTLGRIVIIVLAVSLFGSIPWIYSNARVDLAKYLSELGEGDLFYREGANQQALEHYERALQINFTPELAYKIAGLQMKAGKAQEAIEMLNRAIREENCSELALFVEQEDAHFALGSLYLNQKKIDEAISEFNGALSLWQSRKNNQFKHAPDVYYHLGVAYVQKGDSGKAEGCFLKAIEMADFPPAHLALAQLYAGDPQKSELAQRHLFLYLQKNPNDAAAAAFLEHLKSVHPAKN